jgi:2-polyprenyl-6-hydroxyphenyl methylase/3-demethylubiquinone-9 3-methyltransferase
VHEPLTRPASVTGAIDNSVYDRIGWRDEDSPLSLLGGGMTRARFDYFRGVLVGGLKLNPSGLRALDIGCGGGYLAEEFARLGCAVVGVDPSRPSLAAARAHARHVGLQIDYRAGRGEQLPVADAQFDVVYCCDVLEHVGDLDQVIAETSRALAPGGVYLFDTINRTRLSRLIMIDLAQRWPATRVLDFALHDWNMFVTPAELRAAMNRHGLRPGQIVGLSPASPLAMVGDLVRLKRKRATYAQVAARLRLRPSRILSGPYMGFAIRT